MSPDICVPGYMCPRIYVSPDICVPGYETLSGPIVGYVFSGKLLPRWKEVHAEVLKLIDSLIVEE